MSGFKEKLRKQLTESVVGNFLYTLMELKMLKEYVDVEVIDQKIKECIKENELEGILTQIKTNSEMEILIK